VSALGAASCCCPTEPPVYPGEYYVFSVCAESPCCDLECEGATPVKWCPSYAVAQGLAVPIVLVPGTCIKIEVDCCTYVLTAVVPNPGGVCPTGAGPWNVGTYIGTTTVGEGEGCCDPELIQTPDTCVWQAAYPETPPAASFCLAYVFEEYTLTDQWGIVPSKPVKVTSTLTYCYETFGVKWDEKCDGCIPVQHYPSAVKHVQEIGFCIPVEPLAPCPGARLYEQTTMLDCRECNPCDPCCGIDDCQDVPPGDYCEDPAATYSVRTCYAVNPCLDDEDEETFFEQDVLTVTYDFCATAIDPSSPTALAQLNALFTAGNVVTTWNASTVWAGNDTGIRIALCPGGLFGDPSVYVFSGDANDIAAAINSLGVNFPWLSAEADKEWGECFWFGVRQTCQNCPEDPPGTRPAYGLQASEGADALVFDRCEIIDATSFKAIFRGRSKKYYVCASQTLSGESPDLSPINYSVAPNCTGSSTDVVNLAVSATGDVENGYELHCLSPAEYACGERYSMRQVEQDYCDRAPGQGICTASNPDLLVTACDAVVGYPLSDVVVEGVTVLKGWNSLCALAGMPAIPAMKCRSYPYVYEVKGCESQPYAGLCIDVFQDPDVWCETFATPITVTSAP